MPARALDSTSRRSTEQWFADLFIEHRDDLARYALRLGASKDLCEDLVADAFGRAWAHLRHRDRPRDPLAYLRRVVHNLYIDHVRATRRSISIDALDVSSAAVPSPLVVEDFSARWATTMLAAWALDQLTPAHRQVLICTLADRLTLRETAVAMQLSSEGAAAALAHRARVSLRALRIDRHSMAPAP